MSVNFIRDWSSWTVIWSFHALSPSMCQESLFVCMPVLLCGCNKWGDCLTYYVRPASCSSNSSLAFLFKSSIPLFHSSVQWACLVLASALSELCIIHQCSCDRRRRRWWWLETCSWFLMATRLIDTQPICPRSHHLPSPFQPNAQFTRVHRLKAWSHLAKSAFKHH